MELTFCFSQMTLAVMVIKVRFHKMVGCWQMLDTGKMSNKLSLERKTEFMLSRR